jgi:hypothetical protein
MTFPDLAASARASTVPAPDLRLRQLKAELAGHARVNRHVAADLRPPVFRGRPRPGRCHRRPSLCPACHESASPGDATGSRDRGGLSQVRDDEAGTACGCGDAGKVSEGFGAVRPGELPRFLTGPGRAGYVIRPAGAAEYYR